MKVQRGMFLCLGAVAACALVTIPARAELISLLASDNATVQPAGPRTGSSGKAFFNVEGNGNGAFASFGVADFVFPVPLGFPAGIGNVTLKLTQSNAGFTTDGPISIYLTSQTGVSIQPGTVPPAPAYQSPNNGAASVDPQFSPLTLLTTATFTEVATGTVDSYSLPFTGGALTTLLNAINTAGTLRLIITPDDDATAATWAGYTNSTLVGPTLEVEVVPEPGTTALAALAAIALVVRGRRRNA